MAARNSHDDDLVAEINVTPLVDVVLVLLVIFLITAPVIYQSAIKVQLPKAQSGESAKTSPLTFSLSREGEVAWGEEHVSWENLERKLASLKEAKPDETAVISADTATPHGTVIKLMDLLRKTGIVRFSLNVDSGH